MNQKLSELEYHLSKRDDGLWYIVAVNETGGYEFSTWWGYEDQVDAVTSFQRLFNYPVFDPESMRDYPNTKGERS